MLEKQDVYTHSFSIMNFSIKKIRRLDRYMDRFQMFFQLFLVFAFSK